MPSIGEWRNKFQYFCTMEYYSAEKKINEKLMQQMDKFQNNEPELKESDPKRYILCDYINLWKLKINLQ